MTGSSSSSSSAVLVAGSALLVAAAGLGYAFTTASRPSSSENDGLTEIDDEEQDREEQPGEFITASEVAKVFDRIFLEMQAVFSQLMRQIQQMQMAGQMIPEAQLKPILRGEMEKALTVKQQQILAEFDMDYDCLEEATWEFLDEENKHPEVKKSVERFQKLWESVADEPLVGWRPGKDLPPIQEEPLLSPERTMEVASQYFSALTENMRLLVSKLQAEGANLRDPPVQQRLQMEFAQTANDAGEAALEAMGVTQSQFENSVKEHSEKSDVARHLTMLQVRQNQELMSMGAA